MTAAAELTQKIKDFALREAGFDQLGISKAELPDLHAEAVSSWVEKGFAGSMDYMVRDGSKRAAPQNIMPGAKTVISLVINYYHPEDPKPIDKAVGKVARYAYGRDYHKVIEKKLKQLATFIRQEAGEGAEVKSYVDTGPILEKAFAQRSGLGFFGKNTNLITKNFGSWVFLASLVTNLDLLCDEPHTGACGSCRLCLDACPTSALVDAHTLDARKCISYLTIESKVEHPTELKKGIGEWVFGCDICQEVCPYNWKAKTTTHEDLYPRKIGGTWLELDELESFKSDEEFTLHFQGSPLKRSKRAGFLRNAETVRENVCQK